MTPAALKPGAHGPAVAALQRALHAAGVFPLGPNGLFGPRTKAAVLAFQTANGLDSDAVVGPETMAALAKFYDQHGKWLLTPDPAVALRQAICGYAAGLYAYRDHVHYSQTSGRMQIVREQLRPPWHGEITEDCSSFATACYWLAGAPDPNGTHFDGTGWTGTLCEHGHPVGVAAAQPADLCFYGGGPPWHHVAVYVGNGRVISQGSEAGPFLLPIRYRDDLGQVRSYL